MGDQQVGKNRNKGSMPIRENWLILAGVGTIVRVVDETLFKFYMIYYQLDAAFAAFIVWASYYTLGSLFFR